MNKEVRYTPAVILIFIGCAFLFLALIGGNDKITVPITIPPITELIVRAIVFPLGIFLLFCGIFLAMQSPISKFIKIVVSGNRLVRSK